MAYKPDKHGRDHCPGGEDPIPCFITDYVHMRWEGIEDVTVNTVSAVETLGGGQDYDEGFQLDNSPAGFSYDLNAGWIQCGSDGYYEAHGWAQFNGITTAGCQMGVVLAFGQDGGFSDYNVGNSVIANAINEFYRIPVSRQWGRFNDVGHNTIGLAVWHTDAAGMELNSAYLSVVRLSASAEGTFTP